MSAVRGAHRVGRQVGLAQRVLTNLPQLLTWLTLVFVVYLVTSDPVGSGRRGSASSAVGRAARSAGRGRGHPRGRAAGGSFSGGPKPGKADTHPLAESSVSGQGDHGVGNSLLRGASDLGASDLGSGSEDGAAGASDADSEGAEGQANVLNSDVLDLSEGTGKACQFPFAYATRREKDLFFALHPECEHIRACEAYVFDPEPATPGGVVPQGHTFHSAYISRFSQSIRYMHMVTVEKLRARNNLVAVWQAAPSAGNETKMRLGVEGLDMQHILISISKDSDGRRWVPPQVVPLHNHGALWSPVLHVDRRGVLWLFYSESVGCRKAVVCRRPVCEVGQECRSTPDAEMCHTDPHLWVPGGDIKVTHSIGDPALNTWSEARTILSQDRDGGIPKVIANKLSVLSTGEWLMPFWREQQSALEEGTCERDLETGLSGCSGNKPQRCMTGAKESAGVLVSKDEGVSWQAHGFLTHMNTTLIEGSLAELRNGTVLMVFRTTVGCLYQSMSNDKGKTWVNIKPMTIPNPNSKVHLIRMDPIGDLLLAFNNHRQPGTFRGLKSCRACRSMLHLAVSRDDGNTWEKVAVVDEEISTSAVRIHYPTVVQIDTSKVVVAYSRFYLGRKLGLVSPDQGVRIVGIDLAGVLTADKSKARNTLPASGDGGGGTAVGGRGAVGTVGHRIRGAASEHSAGDHIVTGHSSTGISNRKLPASSAGRNHP